MPQSSDDEPDDAALRARLDKLSKSLGGRGSPAPTPKNVPANGSTGGGSGMGAGMRLVSEIVAGVMVGGGIGWLLDKIIHTQPLFMILLGALGLAGGFWNVIREAMKPPAVK